MGGMGSTGGPRTVDKSGNPIVTSPTSSAGGGGGGGLSTEYEANKPQQMPVYNSPAQIESARKKRQDIMARSGRGSTNLRGNPGTQSYQNSFLGNVA
jgi:hypothetical protein